MAAAGAGGGGASENIHNIITSAPSPLPANVMSRIASFVPNWRKIPEFNAFKNTVFHQTPHQIVEQIRSGDQALLMAYLDYLNSEEFNAARSRYGPERPAEDRQILLSDLLCDTYGRAPFESFKAIIDAGADINANIRFCYGRPITLVLRAKIYNRGRDSLEKFRYLIEMGVETHVYNELDHEWLINLAAYHNFYEELALIVNSGTNITRLSANLMYRPNMPFYLAGILAALLIRNDVITDEVFQQLLTVPPDAMQEAMNRLAVLAKLGRIPSTITKNMINPAFTTFRRLVVGVLGKDATAKAIETVMKAAAGHRRAYAIATSTGGKRRNRTKKRRTRRT